MSFRFADDYCPVRLNLFDIGSPIRIAGSKHRHIPLPRRAVNRKAICPSTFDESCNGVNVSW